MAKDLHTLIRLHQWRVDEKRRALGQLLGEIAELETSVVRLDDGIKSEQRFVNDHAEAAQFDYGAFAAASVQIREYLNGEIEQTEARIIVAQEEMREEFLDLKTFELSQEARDQRVADEAQRQEGYLLDEVGQETFRRGRKSRQT